jgi:2-phosphoglycerate kinase
MIYLIGGPPRVGKTTLTEALAKRISFPYFTLDHVTSVIAPYIPEQEYVTRLPLRVARQETNFSNDVFYAKYTPEEVVDFYLCQAETYWPGVENFIRYAIEDDHDLILEGWQILPHLLQAVVTPENEDKLKVIFLYKNNLENIVSGLKVSIARNDWVIKNTKDESTFLAIAKMMNHFGGYIEKQAKEYNFRSVNTDFNFEERIKESLESILISTIDNN